MKMSRVFLGVGAALMAMQSLGMALTIKDPKAVTLGTKYNIPPRFKKKRGPVPKPSAGRRTGRSGFIVDRSSSVRKIRREHRCGLEAMAPDQRALERHGWYRRVVLKHAHSLVAYEQQMQAAQ